MDKTREKELAKIAAQVRKEGLGAIHQANSGHIGGAFSVADILVTLYFDKMNIDVSNPSWEDRDRFVLSKGHCTGAIYPVLALKGFFPVGDLKTFRKIDSYLSGHIEMKHVPGVDMSAGSLGQGLSVACGMALAGKATGQTYRTYAVCGDGEIEEGQIWEAAMAAGHYKLDNLTAFVDNNGLQIDDTCENLMSIYPIDEKFKSFGWHVINIDGHDFAQISGAVDEAKSVKGKPTMIVAKTVKGKGVSFMENNLKWHGSPPSEEEYEQAIAELDATLERLGS
jgi:transketolase